jgi:2-methylcitrate dehydratase PrpD
VVNYAKCCILDLMGVSLAGSSTSWSRIVVDLVRDLEGKQESTVFASNLKSTSINAALANGTMAHSLDLDDTHNEAIVHPGCAVIPSAMAVAEREGLPGRDLIASVVAGYEVSIRIGLAVSPYHILKGFHPSGTCGVFGATAAVGNLLRFDEDVMTDALGIAGSHAAGLMEFLANGAMTKRLHAGRASASGVQSALLAQRRFTGPNTVLEGANGFCNAYSPKRRLDRLTRLLGERYEILGTGFKLYACCRSFHSAIDVLCELTRLHDVKLDDIARIIIGTDRDAVKYDVREPRTVLAAQMSFPFSVALALITGRCEIGGYAEENLRNQEILKLARRIKLVVDPIVDRNYPRKYGSRSTLVLRNGRRFAKTSWYPRGEPENAFTQEEMNQKFISLASPVMPSPKAQQTLQVIQRLETLNDVSALCLMVSGA